MSFHFIASFVPVPGKEEAFRTELLRVSDSSRAEAGCVAMRIFESQREPLLFALHSEWMDETAFELHATLPHTVRFLEASERLLTHEVKGLRLSQIGGVSSTAWQED